MYLANIVFSCDLTFDALSHLTMTSNGQSQLIQKIFDCLVTFESGRPVRIWVESQSFTGP